MNQNTSVISLNMEVFRLNSSLSRAFSEREWGILTHFFVRVWEGRGMKGEFEKKKTIIKSSNAWGVARGDVEALN